MTSADYTSLGSLWLVFALCLIAFCAWRLTRGADRAARPLGGTLGARNDVAAPMTHPHPTGGSLAAFSDDTRLTPRDREADRA